MPKRDVLTTHLEAKLEELTENEYVNVVIYLTLPPCKHKRYKKVIDHNKKYGETILFPIDALLRKHKCERTSDITVLGTFTTTSNKKVLKILANNLHIKQITLDTRAQKHRFNRSQSA